MCVPFSIFTTLCILFGIESFRCFFWLKLYPENESMTDHIRVFFLLIYKAVSSGPGAGCLQVGWKDSVISAAVRNSAVYRKVFMWLC